MLRAGLIVTLCALALGACASRGGPPAPYAPSPAKVTPPPPPIDVIRPKILGANR
jgi:hypothetical protein